MNKIVEIQRINLVLGVAVLEPAIGGDSVQIVRIPSEIYIGPPSRGELVIEIPSTDPPEVASWIETIIDEMKRLSRQRDSLNKLMTKHGDKTGAQRPESR